MMETTVCNLCGSTNAAQFICDLPDLQFHRNDVSATLVKCPVCGLIYQNPRPSFVEMAAHYHPITNYTRLNLIQRTLHGF